MLKLTYTDAGFHLERVATPLEVTIALRVVLAMRTGGTLYAEPGRASFLLAIDAPGLSHLQAALRLEPSQTVTVDQVDDDYVEVSLSGYWVAESAQAHAGMFITVLSDQAEYFVDKLWHITQSQVSTLI
jgi:hypothetical protein